MVKLTGISFSCYSQKEETRDHSRDYLCAARNTLLSLSLFLSCQVKIIASREGQTYPLTKAACVCASRGRHGNEMKTSVQQTQIHTHLDTLAHAGESRSIVTDTARYLLLLHSAILFATSVSGAHATAECDSFYPVSNSLSHSSHLSFSQKKGHWSSSLRFLGITNARSFMLKCNCQQPVKFIYHSRHIEYLAIRTYCHTNHR